MPPFVEGQWPGDPNAMGGRKARLGFSYQAFVPPPIADWDGQLGASESAWLLRATEALRRLQDPHQALGLEALSRQLLRSEGIASSWIEGLILPQDRVMRALYLPHRASDGALMVARNIEAMEAAWGQAGDGQAIRVEDLLGWHARLFAQGPQARWAGAFRSQQNWLGGNAFNPRQAEYIPPPPEFLPDLMADLCAFLNRDDLPAIWQAAMAHAQFENIHPFPDGNGRVGRVLIHWVLRAKGAAPQHVPPISLILATNAKRYVAGLTRFRDPDGWGEWVHFFTRALLSACEQAEGLAQAVQRLQATWRQAAQHPRKASAADKIIQALPQHPILDGPRAMAITGASDEAVRKALALLEGAGVLEAIEPGRARGRAWEATSLMRLLDAFEWRMATPTQEGQARRPAPKRPPS